MHMHMYMYELVWGEPGTLVKYKIGSEKAAPLPRRGWSSPGHLSTRVPLEEQQLQPPRAARPRAAALHGDATQLGNGHAGADPAVP